MELKTLLDRAKPELIAALNAQMDEYPGIVESVVKHLDSTYTVTHLNWGMWIDVRSLWMHTTKELLDSPWDCFDDL